MTVKSIALRKYKNGIDSYTNDLNLFMYSLVYLPQIFAISFALDTAALLGGNEYLIKQMLTEIENLEYNEKELEVLKWGLTEVKI